MTLTSALGRRVSLVPLVTVAVLTLGTSSAYAYWSTTGRGSGSASTGTLTVKANALTATDVTTNYLLPGGTAEALVSVTNPNAFAVTLTSVTGRGAAVADNSCNTSGVTFIDKTGLTTSLAAGATQVLHLSGAVSMSLAVTNACQGASFTIPVTVIVQK